MHRKTTLYLLPLLAIISCRQVSNRQSLNTSTKDSALRIYFNHIDKLLKNDIKFYDIDSNEFNLKMLKAYYSNDTTYLMNVVQNINDPDNDNPVLDSFWKANIPILKNLNSEEAYQFQYSETFCQTFYIITISKLKDSVRLNTFIYTPRNTYNDKPIELEIVRNTNKSLSLENWNELLESINLADYWNLKPRNDNVVLDPSFLTIVGIKKDKWDNKIKRTNSVTRTVFRKTALYKAFLLSLKFAEIEKLCE